MTCLLVGATALALAGGDFRLAWTHSVERIEWREEWRIEGGALHLIRAAVRGSGAGMEPGAGAVLREGWWVWTPDLPPQPQITLAASGATGGGWQLCDARGCTEFGADAGQPVTLAPCP